MKRIKDMTSKDKGKIKKFIKRFFWFIVFCFFFFILLPFVVDLILDVDRNDFYNDIKDVIDESLEKYKLEKNKKIEICYSGSNDKINYYILFDTKGNIKKMNASNEKYYYTSAKSIKGENGVYTTLYPVEKDKISMDSIQKLKGRVIETCN